MIEVIGTGRTKKKKPIEYHANKTDAGYVQATILTKPVILLFVVIGTNEK